MLINPLQAEPQRLFILYCFIPSSPDETKINQWVSLLQPEERVKLSGFVHPPARLRFLFGRMLFRKMLQQCSPETSPQLTYSLYGKPYLAHAPNIGINLAHCGQLVVCALAFGTEVGVDVEAIRLVELAVYRSSFSDFEWTRIQDDAQPMRAFFELWTRKEALSKANGQGLGIPLETLDGLGDIVQVGTTAWACKNLALPDGYVGAIAYNCDSNIQSIHCEQVDLMQDVASDGGLR